MKLLLLLPLPASLPTALQEVIKEWKGIAGEDEDDSRRHHHHGGTCEGDCKLDMGFCAFVSPLISLSVPLSLATLSRLQRAL